MSDVWTDPALSGAVTGSGRGLPPFSPDSSPKDPFRRDTKGSASPERKRPAAPRGET